MISEQYKIKGMAQAETIRHKRDLWTFIERTWAFCEDSVVISRPSHARGEMHTKVLDSLVTR